MRDLPCEKGDVAATSHTEHLQGGGKISWLQEKKLSEWWWGCVGGVRDGAGVRMGKM